MEVVPVDPRDSRAISPILDLLQLDETIDPLTFRGRSPADSVNDRVFGGQVAAQALIAAGRTVPAERAVHSMHAYFLRRGDPKIPLEYRVDVLRDGSSYSVRNTSAYQQGVQVFQLTASFQRPMWGLSHQPSAPPAPDPESIPTAGDAFGADEAGGAWLWAILQAFPLDMRFVTPPPRVAFARGSDTAPRTLFWVRPIGGMPGRSALMHAGMLTYLSDLFLLTAALPPHGVRFGDREPRVASLDHAMWFHRPVRTDDWVLYDLEGYWADDGRAVSRGMFYDRQGSLLASVMQEGVIRLVGGESG
jgi:acyl-CoA thioesterase II